MTLPVVLVLAVGIYTLRALGMFALAGRQIGEQLHATLQLIPVVVIAAVVSLQVFTQGQDLRVDARAWGAAVAAVAAWRRVPLIVVLVASSAVTAVVRAAGWAP